MKARTFLGVASRVSVPAMLLLPAVGCPWKRAVLHLSPETLLFLADEGGPTPVDQTVARTGV